MRYKVPSVIFWGEVRTEDIYLGLTGKSAWGIYSNGSKSNDLGCENIDREVKAGVLVMVVLLQTIIFNSH